MTGEHDVSELTRMLHQLRRREARRRGGEELTYRELAARTGWSLGIIAQYFSGKSLPPVGRFDVLIRLLGATPAEQGVLATQRDRADEQRRRPSDVVATARRSEIRLLGPVEVIGPRGAAKLVGVRQRALVSLLALEAGRAVTQTRMLDVLWGQTPPRTAVQTLYSHIARVRQSLDACGLPGLLVTRNSGYALMAKPEDVDVIRFEKAVVQARRTEDLSNVVRILHEALALWRGDALADAPSAGWIAAEVDRLHELRVSAQGSMWDARLRLGEHTAAVDELEKLLVTNPTRERLVELFMLALYRCDRHTDALEAYQRLRGHLAEQLGVAPGPALVRLHTAVLQRSPDLDLGVCPQPPRKPAQLPSRVGHFVGRARDLTVLNGVLTGSARVGRVGVVHGPAGMGKTALAVEWAHSMTNRYSDGQLFLDLRGHDPMTALALAETLTHLLHGLGMPSGDIPSDSDGMQGLYRSMLHNRRVLIVLDNAASADQVAPLVPPSSGSLLLVTSRSRLAGLTVDYAVTSVELDQLPPGEALELLSRVLGADRVADEREAASELAESCGRMPLALRIAAAKLAVRPMQTIAELADALAGTDRLDTLAVPGDSRSIRAVFATAYQALSPAAARMFRRLGAFSGVCFSPALAATLADVSYADGLCTLEELVGVHLVAEMGNGWYRFHDLIRLYAGEQSEPDEAAATVTRVADWYLTVADAANRLFDPARDRAGPIDVHPPVEVPFPSDHDSALAFLDSERPNLLAVIRHIGDSGLNRSAWQLAYLLTSFTMLRGYRAEQVEMCSVGLAAAQRLADPAAEALLHSLLGMAHNAMRQPQAALVHLQHALPLIRAIGDRRGEGMALNNIALAYGQLGRLQEAADAFGQALQTHTRNGNPPGMALALNNIGHAYTLMGKIDLAWEPLDRALALAREIGNPHLEATTLHSLGQARLAVPDSDGALDAFNAALTIWRRIGERRSEADTLNLIGLTHRARGERAEAATHFQQALELCRELRDRHLEAVTLGHLSDDPDGDHRRAVADRAH